MERREAWTRTITSAADRLKYEREEERRHVFRSEAVSLMSPGDVQKVQELKRKEMWLHEEVDRRVRRSSTLQSSSKVKATVEAEFDEEIRRTGARAADRLCKLSSELETFWKTHAQRIGHKRRQQIWLAGGTSSCRPEPAWRPPEHCFF